MGVGVFVYWSKLVAASLVDCEVIAKPPARNEKLHQLCLALLVSVPVALLCTALTPSFLAFYNQSVKRFCVCWVHKCTLCVRNSKGIQQQMLYSVSIIPISCVAL